MVSFWARAWRTQHAHAQRDFAGQVAEQAHLGFVETVGPAAVDLEQAATLPPTQGQRDQRTVPSANGAPG